MKYRVFDIDSRCYLPETYLNQEGSLFDSKLREQTGNLVIEKHIGCDAQESKVFVGDILKYKGRFYAVIWQGAFFIKHRPLNQFEKDLCEADKVEFIIKPLINLLIKRSIVVGNVHFNSF